MRCDGISFKGTVETALSDKNWKIDIPVLLIFFNRPKTLAKVFEAVKYARPSRLYLYQDGARIGKNDTDNVEACREIVSQIDWSCEIHRLYQMENFGCDPSEYIAQKWMFSHENMGIVIEDDDVPSQSFFPFCKELLEKYKDDRRIAMICGMNNYDVEETVSSSYFFSKRGSITAWASWKRFIDMWDPHYDWLDDPQKLKKIEQYCTRESDYGKYIQTAMKHKESGREHYESILFEAAAVNDMLNIVPKYNMICNIGIDCESTHSGSDVRLMTKRTQRIFYKKIYEIEFPLIHPETMEQNLHFDNLYYTTGFQKLCDRIEYGFRLLLFAKPSDNIKKIRKRLHI